MIKMLNDEKLVYEPGNIVWEENKCVQVAGKLSVTKKTSRNNSFYLLISILDETKKKSLTQIVFNRNPLFDFLQDYEKQRIPCRADIKFIKSGQYESMEIHRLHIEVPSEEEIQEAKVIKEANDKSMSSRVSEAIKSIKEPNLRKLCFNVYKDKELVERILKTPATEHSAYNEKGGLMHMIADTVTLANTMVNSLNNDFGDDSTKFNLDLMKAGAILCNIGRALIYEYDELGNITKTEAGIVDNELLMTRDIVMKALNEMRGQTDKEGVPYDVESDIIKELLHMLVTSKNKLESSSLVLPRSKHALLLSDIVSIVFTKGLFDNLEKTTNEKFTRAYDNGRTYALYNNTND
jgi:hypothetical protein